MLPVADRNGRYVHLIGRHIALWMRAQYDPDIRVDGQPAVYVPGSASDPNPSPAFDARPVTPIVTAWWMLSSVALRAGLPFDEVLGWPGIADVRAYSVLDVLLRQSLIEAAISRQSLPDFQRFAVGAVEAMGELARMHTADARPNPLSPERRTVPALTPADLSEGTYWSMLRQFTVAMAMGLVLPQSGTIDLGPLHKIANALAGVEVMPEWQNGARGAESDLASVVAVYLRVVALGESVPPGGLFMLHLRLFEWINGSGFADVLEPVLAKRVASDWAFVLDKSTALLTNPKATVPPLRAALASGRETKAFVAGVLLAASPAVSAGLSESYRLSLQEHVRTVSVAPTPPSPEPGCR